MMKERVMERGDRGQETQREGVKQRAEEGRVVDGEDKERGHTLGTLPEDGSNGSQDMAMGMYEENYGEVIGEEGGEDTLLVAQATGWITQ